MVAVRVQGADELLRVSKGLKRLAPEVRKDLNKRLKAEAKPMIAATRQAALRTLPAGGGLNRVIARRPMRVKVATGANPGVSIVAAKTDPRIDQGRIRHPVFGRQPGVTQRVQPGFFSDTLEGEGPRVQQALVDVIQDFSDQLEGLG